MDVRLQIFSILATVGLLLVVLELVRRKRLLERYALLWLFSALVLLGLGIWKDALTSLSGLVGIAYPPSALFVAAGGFILLLLLHFSVVISRLTDQSKVLAQRVALLEERTRERPGAAPRRAELRSPRAVAGARRFDGDVDPERQLEPEPAEPLLSRAQRR